MNLITLPVIEFKLPGHLTCPKPTEERNLPRDQVRLLVTTADGRHHHTRFDHFPDYLQQGDVLIVNTSATVAAALPVLLPGGSSGRLHISTKLDEGGWLIEIREIIGNKTVRWHKGEEGMLLQLPDAATVILKKRFYKNEQWLNLWEASFKTRQPMKEWLTANGRPIQYENLDHPYPLSYYQTFFSFHPGSSEMPSAGRGFTPGIINKLLKKGVVLAPVILHTGVSSMEENETPYPEYVEVDPVTAAIINNAKKAGKRIIATGTTCIRAIETAVNAEGIVVPFRGNTDLFIDAGYTMKIVDGLLTGFHEPRASHLNMLQSIAGFDHLDKAYKEAIKANYFWHQFGDLHLILS